MSFFSNFQSDRCPGPMSGNPMNGLSEKVCIQVKKVFDACLRQTQEDDLLITLSNFTPPSPVYPLTFISAKSTGTKTTVSNISIDMLPDRPRCARVQCDLIAPLEVIYVDANGVEGKADSSVTIHQDVIMFVPSPSIIPYTVDAVVSIIAPEGTFISEGQFSITCCVTVILKIVMDVELLVPSYGYCQLPPCQEYSQEVCAGFFELPLFPGQPGPAAQG